MEDGQGGKYTLSFNGGLSPERMTKISEFLQNSQQNNTPETIEFNSNTTYGKIIKLIETKFPLGSFTSNDILELYEDEYNEPSKLSTIATYLSRLYEKDMLQREKTKSGWIYTRPKIINTIQQLQMIKNEA